VIAKFRNRRPLSSLVAGALLVALVLSVSAWAQVDGQYYVHAAKDRDTLVHIAKRYLVRENDWQSLQKLNRIADPHNIRPGTPIRIPLTEMKTEPATGTVVSADGPVETTGGTLARGSTVKEGEEIRTGENGFVTIKLADGSTIVVQSKSQVRMDIARTIANTGIPVTRALLTSGRVEAKVQKLSGAGGRFEVATPTSNMGVRGTQFRVSSDDGGKTSRGEVLEGLVSVAGAGATKALDLNAGFGTIVEQGRAPVDPVRLLPPPNLSAVASLHERILLRFKFGESAGASGYRAQVAADQSFSDLRAEGVFKTAEAKFGGLADGAYFLRVRAIDERGIEGADTVLPFRLKARPEAPFTSAPQNKAKFSGDKADFTWSASMEAASYRFQLARNPGFTSLVADEKALRNTNYTTTAKLVPGEYFWRVGSTRADGDSGPYGDVQAFTLKPVPPAPNPPKEDGDRIGFSWGAEPGQKFDFQLARDPAFKDLVMERNLDRPEIAITKPGDAGTYYMRFRSIDPDGFVAPYSSAQTFEVKRDFWWLLLLFPLLLA
jgi:hypothetical protein